MIFLIALFTVLHILFYLKHALGWRKVLPPSKRDQQSPFSIVIPVRNEEENIERIIRNLDSQDYPNSLYEVIIVDDFSEDQTVEKATKLKNELNLNLQIIKLNDPAKQGKKHALTKGIRSASHDRILTTDADCWFGNGWIQAYNNVFEDSLNMIAGPVAIQGKGLFARLQQVEFAGLIGFGAVTISTENPSMCSGANLGFRKSAFEAVDGYEDNLFTPSGDDEFLLYSIMHQFPHTARFLKSQDAIVNTPAHSGLSGFINQRTRWTSKWKHNRNKKVRWNAVLFFFDYLFFYIAIIGAFLSWFCPVMITGIVLARFIAILSFVGPVNRFMIGKHAFWPMLVFQIIYPLHVLFMGMNSIFGSYTWKGRKYR